jgi:hypothetical protein
MHSTLKYPLILAGFSMFFACGGSTPPPQSGPTQVTPENMNAPGEDNTSGMSVSGQLGSLDPNAVERTFEHLQGKFQNCFKSGLSRVEYLGGDVSIFLRIGLDGSVKYTYFEDSSVGDRETEKCILGIVSSTSWPKPKGGEAEARKSFGFDAPADVRAPTSWNSDNIAAAVGKAQGEIAKCKGGVSGNFKGAAYVQPDGKHGKVQAAGLASPSNDGVDKIDCLLGVVQGLQLPSPGSYAAKVSFAL